MSMIKVRPYKALSIGFFSLVLLAGCGDNEPSSSEIKKQLLSQLSPCPELSIADFQKLNGYPQNDGSYIDQVQYTVNFNPSNAMRSLLSDYDKKQQTLASNAAAARAKFQTLDAQAASVSATCNNAYQSTVDGYNSTLKNIGLSLDDQENPDQGKDSGELNSLISQQTDILLLAQKALARDSSDQWQPPSNPNASDDFDPYQPAPPPPSAQEVAANKQLQQKAVAEDKQNIETVMQSIDELKQIEAQYVTTAKDFQTCYGTAQQIEQEAQTPVSGTTDLGAALRTQISQDEYSIYNDLNEDCPINASGRVLGMFNLSGDDPDSYVKALSVQFSGNVHLVKSDNGWVIQN